MIEHEPGRHAAYILTAYGITALTLLGLLIDSLYRAAIWRRRAGDRKDIP